MNVTICLIMVKRLFTLSGRNCSTQKTTSFFTHLCQVLTFECQAMSIPWVILSFFLFGVELSEASNPWCVFSVSCLPCFLGTTALPSSSGVTCTLLIAVSFNRWVFLCLFLLGGADPADPVLPPLPEGSLSAAVQLDVGRPLTAGQHSPHHGGSEEAPHTVLNTDGAMPAFAEAKPLN